ncbi:MAG: UPF0262 family protein [Alphaproteobacteria bacterium]|jgi:uncharacterized protein (UPF0262 family)|nr:UPF0262 family protein [Alphaproteobacteria bacterium]MBT4084423.1 UPF0262 family protein [Alphaproteobacteria bacterium]MBT4545645.1 UPF0262 family protein [Alphaproteobacteria bacterium]MBT7748102.1 UPF0262 family protein [Alphaproteobacteria bacterium]
MDKSERIVDFKLDEATVVRRSPEVEHERKIAVFDLLEENSFSPVGDFTGPYHLRLSIVEGRLAFDIRDGSDEPVKSVILALSPFRRIVNEYFEICDSYFTAIKASTPSQIEAIDMGRRGLHNDGSDLLRERLAEKIELDHPTARRLFTLICVLHIRG